ncbi:MAG: VWA domain-containing protein [Paracoccaceae bacterium]
MPEFEQPWFLVLLGLPVLIFLFGPRHMPGGAALIVPEGVGRHILSGTAELGQFSKRRYGTPAVIWVLMVIALAGPRVVAPVTALPTSGRDLMLALDLSGSMVRDDFFLDGKAVTRLDAVKAVGTDFVRTRGGDRVGLVVFGSEAYVAAPPTFDVEAVAQTVEQLVIGISGRATNISDALGISLKRLADTDAKSKVIILLSDGANNAGAATPRDVAKLARDMGVRVHTIALGPKELSQSPGERGVVDAITLGALADLSGGEMFRVRTTEDLRTVIDAINTLEPVARAGLSAQVYKDLWIWPALLAALGCLWLGWRSPQ